MKHRIFNHVVSLLPIGLIIFNLTACSVDDSALRARATSFAELLLKLDTFSEDQAKLKLKEYILPTTNQDRRIAQYYRQFSTSNKMYKTQSARVGEITFNSDKDRAEVNFHTVSLGPNGMKLPILQSSQWKLENQQWYRVVSQATLSVDLDNL